MGSLNLINIGILSKLQANYWALLLKLQPTYNSEKSQHITILGNYMYYKITYYISTIPLQDIWNMLSPTR